METSNQRTQIANQLLQHLNYLAKAGIETLPAGKGEQHFHFADKPLQNDSADSLVDSPTEDAPGLHQPTFKQTEVKADSAAAIKEKEPAIVPVREEPAIYRKSDERISPAQASRDEIADSTSYPVSMSLEQRRLTLDQVSEKVTACTLCPELVGCRNRVVFGVGNIAPKLVFLGEAPGADEDRTGEPFVGAAGQLLDKIISACKIKRSEVYILNTIKCRPPRNRNPEPSELANCWQFTERQLEILRPEFICCLGAVASKQLLKTTSPLGQLRQKFHRYRDSKVVVTYHPSYLLRTESAKKFVWEDMKMLLREMGIEL